MKYVALKWICLGIDVQKVSAYIGKFYFVMVFACLFFFGIAKPMLVDRGFVSWSCQIKDNTHGISCFSVRHTVLRRKIGSESR